MNYTSLSQGQQPRALGLSIYLFGLPDVVGWSGIWDKNIHKIKDQFKGKFLYFRTFEGALLGIKD